MTFMKHAKHILQRLIKESLCLKKKKKKTAKMWTLLTVKNISESVTFARNTRRLKQMKKANFFIAKFL